MCKVRLGVFGRSVILIAAVTLVIFNSVVPGETGQAVPDQQQTDSDDWYVGVGVTQEVAQTFTPGVNGKLRKISVMLAKHVGFNDRTHEEVYPGNLIVEIQSTVWEDTTQQLVPSGHVLATATLPESEIEAFTPRWYDILFRKSPVLSLEETYAIVLRTNDGLPEDWWIQPGSYVWYEAGNIESDPYPDGTQLIRNSKTSFEWTENTYWFIDATFITYMK